jgi:sugar/nucleoside kinase (ribokinase family)
MRTILCIGSASVDIKAFSHQEDIQNAYRKGTIDLVPGGVARCMAMNLKHLGFETALYSVIGSDIFGEFLRSGLLSAGVDTTLLRTSATRKTALFSVMGAQGSSSSCVYSNEVLEEIVADEEFSGFVARAKIDTIVMDSNVQLPMLEAVYRLKAKRAGTEPLFIFQNATSPDIARKSLPWAHLVDLFAANEFEAAAILGGRPIPDVNTANRFRELGYKNFIITFGEEGVLVGIGEKTWIEEPYKPSVIVDTIGAGDAFASGFLYGYLGGKSEKKCIQFGLACAKETLATRDTVCHFLTPEYVENYPHTANPNPKQGA